MILDPRLARTWFGRDTAALLSYPERYAATGMQVVQVDYPIIDMSVQWESQGREVLLRVDATDYDYRPPSGWWIDSSGEPLLGGTGMIPAGGGFQHESNPLGLSRAWFCFPGWREYHDHPGHQTPTWASLRRRAPYRIIALITQLHADLNKPGIQVV